MVVAIEDVLLCPNLLFHIKSALFCGQVLRRRRVDELLWAELADRRYAPASFGSTASPTVRKKRKKQETSPGRQLSLLLCMVRCAWMHGWQRPPIPTRRQQRMERARRGPRKLEGGRGRLRASPRPAVLRRQSTLAIPSHLRAPRYLRRPVRDPINRGRGPTSWIAPGRAPGTTEPPVSPHMMLVSKSISSLPRSFHHGL